VDVPMASTVLTDPLREVQWGRWYAWGALFIFLLLPLTWAGRSMRVAYVGATVVERQEAAMTKALTFIEQDFATLMDDLLAEARAVAESPEVVRNLRRLSEEQGAEAVEQLVQAVTTRPLAVRRALELYDPAPQVVAWNGFSIPMDEAPSSPRFQTAFQTAIALDGVKREAVVAWWPVREGPRVLGAVRMMQLVGFKAPVRNQYLRDFSLDETWSRDTGLAVRVRLGDAGEETVPAAGMARLLQGPDGAVLGRVVVSPPRAEALIRGVEQRFDDVLAFWSTLLLSWLMGGAWHWYRRGRASTEQQSMLAGPRFLLVATFWWMLRYLLLALDVPARWQQGKAPLAPLFDPIHLASSMGGGFMRSSGDLLITALFAVVFSGACLYAAGPLRSLIIGLPAQREKGRAHAFHTGAAVQLAAWLIPGSLLVYGLTLGLAFVTRHAVLDSTLDYLSRSGLLPEQLVLVVFSALLLFTLSVVLLSVALIWLGLVFIGRGGLITARWGTWVVGGVLGLLLPLWGVYVLAGAGRLLPWWASILLLLVGVTVAVFGLVRQGPGLGLLTLRSVLPALFMLALLLYPLLYQGLDVQRRTWMRDAVDAFVEGQDPRITYGIEQVFQTAQAVEELPERVATQPNGPETQVWLDSLATSILRGSLLASLGRFDVSLTFLDARGTPRGRFYAADQSLGRAMLDQMDQEEFEILRDMYADQNTTGMMVQRMTSPLELDRFRYEGLAPLRKAGAGPPVGWMLARAVPQGLLREGSTPFPRVLVPTGLYSIPNAELSMAEFRDGILVRTQGRNFGRYRLAEDVREDLKTQPDLWRHETVKAQQFLTYYSRRSTEPSPAGAARFDARSTVIAVRFSSITMFDHLYYLLRLTVAGLFIGLPIYLIGLYLRRRAGQLPAPRVQFRDKVLNAFFTVGIIMVGAMGFAGLQVVTGENERAIQSWLRQHLERVEEALILEARATEMPYRVLDRMHIDSLAARVGLDLNIYRATRLVASSQPQLIRDRLIDQRLPAEAYKALYFDGFRFTSSNEQVGTFSYTTGFRALSDEQGRPRYVISVPTLPEQERIEEERARTVAYLFGALLLLVLVVMLTAALLANALTRPIGRLREGLEAVARGRFESIPAVDTRDEIGELVQTFNTMQKQLADSRRRLAHQERQLAWREMARQVAHEIKNPLTPMKLSVQHLQRAYEPVDPSLDPSVPSRVRKFAALFHRITGTLIEQIDALARIANEFSSFARMPHQVLEPLDLNEVVREAVSLMQEEAQAWITTDLWPDPLILQADREALRRIYINFIKNAIQAIPEGVPGRIHVTTTLDIRPEGRWAYSRVDDNGVGIPEALEDKIFVPSFSTKTSGTGLGLAIVKKSVEDLQGEIGFETDPEAGTTFWIRLPLVQEG